MTFDSDRRQLLRGADVVHISPKAFRLLEALVESRPRAIAKADLYERLWPGLFVTEGNLASLVSEVRDALGDDARRPAYVRTVHGFGYAFAAEPPSGAATPSGLTVIHRLTWGQTDIDLSEGENVVGRERDAGVWIADPSVSRRHARFTVSGDGVTLEDLGSKNGTFVGERRLGADAVPLSDGDAVRIGTVSLTFHTVSTTASTLTKTDG